MRPGLALFVKTPARSPVKSRLWPAIGREAAEALYLDCAAACAEIARSLHEAGRLHAYWAVAEPDVAIGPDDGKEGDCANPWQELACLSQGDGGLGERMATVYQQLLARHGAALLIGTDVPQVTAMAIAEACAVLVDGLADLVIGPSDDGGFWLVGGRTTLPQSSWTAPRYSTGCARADFLAALPDGLHVHHLPQLRDLDEADDLAAVAGALRALPAPTPAQLRALHRLDLLCATIGR